MSSTYTLTLKGNHHDPHFSSMLGSLLDPYLSLRDMREPLGILVDIMKKMPRGSLYLYMSNAIDLDSDKGHIQVWGDDATWFKAEFSWLADDMHTMKIEFNALDSLSPPKYLRVTSDVPYHSYYYLFRDDYIKLQGFFDRAVIVHDANKVTLLAWGARNEEPLEEKLKNYPDGLELCMIPKRFLGGE